VCLGPLPLGAWRLPTPRTLARGAGWIHIPSSAGRPASEPSVPWPRINAQRFTYQPRTGTPCLPSGR
jgi:hypothetical protein